MRHEPRLDRRGFLRSSLSIGSLGVVGGSGGLGLFATRPWAQPALWGADRAEVGERTLVLVQLSGGNDGLSTIVPHADDAYHRARQRTRIEGRDVLPLNELRGLNPELERLHARYHEGGLAIVEGAGYPDPNRSHFKSLEIWHTANPEGRATGAGWIGRLCEAAFGVEAHPNRVIHIGGAAPYSVYSARHPAATLSAPNGYRWVRHGEAVERLTASQAERSDAVGDAAAEAMNRSGEQLDFLRGRMRDAQRSSARLRAALARYRTPVQYPGGDLFADALRASAALIAGDVGVRVLSVELFGFDTHADQHGRHQTLMRRLDRGLSAFLSDLERTEVGRNTVVLAFSEFGRRVAENASGGTDHGCAGPMFVAGARVKGGLYGAPPSLTELDGGDLAYTTDFRSVYAELIAGGFGLAPERVLGVDYPRLGFLG